MTAINQLYNNFIGIDIAKSTFVVSVNEGATTTFDNHIEGITKFYRTYKKLLLEGLVVLETTGGYENEVVNFLLDKKCAVHRAHAQKVKYYIRSLGLRGKTDNIDAKALSKYGKERHQDFVLVQKGKAIMDQLHSLVMRRDDLIAMQTQEKNRLQSPNKKAVQENIKKVLEFLAEQIREIDNDIKSLSNQDNELQERIEVLKTIDGIGDTVAINLLVLLPELGTVDRRKIASLSGVAPHPKDSGQYSGYRGISGGRSHVKTKLCLAALSASRSKGELGGYYQGLISRGKKPMVAIVALIRKIIVIANARIRDHFADTNVAVGTLASIC